MAKLVFQAADLRRVVEHSLAALDQRGQVVDYDLKTGNAITKPVPAPAVILVHDDGVYLTSNGTPRDVVPDASRPGNPAEDGRSYVAYAKGCHPKIDGDAFWDNARRLVGGDDFAETLPWAGDIKNAIDAGAKTIIINFGKTRVSMSAK